MDVFGQSVISEMLQIMSLTEINVYCTVIDPKSETALCQSTERQTIDHRSTKKQDWQRPVSTLLSPGILAEIYHG